MVANDDHRSTSIGSEDEMHVTSDNDDVMNGHTMMTVTDVECPHCDFRCNSAVSMTQHSWEQHPLLMRRKKHLITSSDSSKTGKNAPPVQHTLQQMENCKLSTETAQLRSREQPLESQTQASIAFRNNAMRSLSLLSTAAAILEQQSQQTPHRHIAVVKPQPAETQQLPRPYHAYPDHSIYAPMYNAFIPGLNQYVSIPIQMGPGVPSPAILNASFEDAMNGYPHTQLPRNTQFSHPIPFVPQQNPTQPAPLAKSTTEPKRHTSEEIRTLLQTNNPIRKMSPQSQSSTESSSVKTLPQMETSTTTSQQPPLEKDRLQALEKAILSMDCCDINDTSTKMPFKCADGVWRLVSFKCIRGLWVVQTPESTTPTVYVPCDGDKMAPKIAPREFRRGGRSMSEGSGNKRKLSENIRNEMPVEAKRLCASAPVPSMKSENVLQEREMTLKRTLSNPFITKSLPRPSQHFTNNEGKRVNISMIKRNNAAQSSSCSLIKSLLLRKPVQMKPTVTSNAHNVTSQINNNELQYKSPPGNQLAPSLNPRPLSKSSMAY